MKEALEKKGLKPVHAEVGMYPETSVRLEGKDAESMVKLVQALEDHDDVQNVYANYDIDDALHGAAVLRLRLRVSTEGHARTTRGPDKEKQNLVGLDLRASDFRYRQ